MAKKFVRGITGVEDIESFDKSLTNVNDIVSDGQDTYVHTKKGKNESYYNLTDSVKQLVSCDDLLTITKNDGTVSISNKSLATKQELATKENTLSVDYGLRKNNNTLSIIYTGVDEGFDLNELTNGRIVGTNFVNSPAENNWLFIESYQHGSVTFQKATKMFSGNTSYIRSRSNNVWGVWREQVGDKSEIDSLLDQKQNNISSNASVGVYGSSLRQLYALKQIYTHSNGYLKTHVKSLSLNTTLDTPEEEFNFIVKINKGAGAATFKLNEHDKLKFTNIVTNYGENNTVSISGCVFTLSGSTLTVSTANNTDQNYVITFSDII